MRGKQCGKGPFRRQQRGISLLETLVAVAILAAIGVTFIGGVSTALKATALADEQTTAESLAQGQMERIKKVTYVEGAESYTPATLPDIDDYRDYAVSVAAQPLNSPDAGLQKITVTVTHDGVTVYTLEGYKRQR